MFFKMLSICITRNGIYCPSFQTSIFIQTLDIYIFEYSSKVLIFFTAVNEIFLFFIRLINILNIKNKFAEKINKMNFKNKMILKNHITPTQQLHQGV